MVWKKDDPAVSIHRWTLKSVGRASSERKMTSASGASKIGSGEGAEKIIEVWDGSKVWRVPRPRCFSTFQSRLMALIRSIEL